MHTQERGQRSRRCAPIGEPSQPSGRLRNRPSPIWSCARCDSSVCGRPLLPARNAPSWDDSASPASLRSSCRALPWPLGGAGLRRAALPRRCKSTFRALAERSAGTSSTDPTPASSVAPEPRRSRNPPPRKGCGDLEVASERAQR